MLASKPPSSDAASRTSGNTSSDTAYRGEPYRLPPPPKRPDRGASLLPAPIASYTGNVAVGDSQPMFFAEDGPFNTLLSAVIQQRKDISQVRHRIELQRQDLDQKFPLNQVAYNDLLDGLRVAMPSILTSRDIPEFVKSFFREPWRKFAKLTETLDYWQVRLDSEKNELGRLERALLDKEIKLYDSLEHLVRPIPPVDVLSNTVMPGTIPIASAVPQLYEEFDDRDPDEKAYYYTIGTIHLLREEVFNLESDYQIQSREREEAEQENQAFEETDEEFFGRFFQDRRELTERFFRAKSEIEEFAARCRANGIEVEPPVLPPFLDRMFTDNEETYIKPKVNDPQATDQTNLRIIRWLRDLLRWSLPKTVDLADSGSPIDLEAATSNDRMFLKAPRHKKPGGWHFKELPTMNRGISSPAKRGPLSFCGESSTFTRRRDSMPHLPNIWLLDPVKEFFDVNIPSPDLCKMCVEERRPASVA